MPLVGLLPFLLSLTLACAQPPARCDEATLPWGADMHPSALRRCVADRFRERCTETDACLVACWTRGSDLFVMLDGAVVPIGGGCYHLCQTGNSPDAGPPPLNACEDRLTDRTPPEAPLVVLPPPDAPTPWTARLLAAMDADPKAIAALCTPAHAAIAA